MSLSHSNSASSRGLYQNQNALKVSNLSVSVGSKVILNDVSFECAAGAVALLGRNGAGKTTLIKALCGLCRTSGEIAVISGGTEIRIDNLSPAKRASYTAYLPQSAPKAVHLSAAEFVAMGKVRYTGIFGTPGGKELKNACEELEKLGAGHLADRFYDTLSGGEQKAVSLARANLQGAVWTLLDEPYAGLDFERQHAFSVMLMKNAAENKEKGILVSVHDPSAAMRYFDRIIVLDGGKLAAVLEKDRSDFEEKYLDVLRRLYGKNVEFADTSIGKTVIWRD